MTRNSCAYPPKWAIPSPAILYPRFGPRHGRIRRQQALLLAQRLPDLTSSRYP